MNSKQFTMWMRIRDWCLEHPNKKAAIFRMDGNFVIEYVPHKPKPAIIVVHHYDQEPDEKL